mgnify:CR=1 FL=1
MSSDSKRKKNNSGIKKSRTRAKKILSGSQGLSYKYLKKMVEHPTKIPYKDFVKLYEKSDKYPETLLDIPNGFNKPKWLSSTKINNAPIKLKSRVVGTLQAFNPVKGDDEEEWEEYLKLAIVVAKVDETTFSSNLSKNPEDDTFPLDDKLHYAIVDFGMVDTINYKFTSFNAESHKKCRETLHGSPFGKIQNLN